MKFIIETWTISKLLQTYEEGKLNLNPPYQRNDIWPPISKKRLIESIKLNYPLPAFFIHEKGDNNYDIVDGQQRTRTFIGYKRKFFPDQKKKYFGLEDQDLFDRFQLSVTIISGEDTDAGSIEDFYFRVNKYGIKLNRPEIKRSEFPNTLVQNLIEKLAENDNFTRLGLFKAKSLDRLNDLDFISELFALLKYGITEKKVAADKLYVELKEQSEAEALEDKFNAILDRISELNEVFPFANTRYRQRNDFYTLFNFILKHSDHLDQELLIYQYKLLILVGEDIYPTNEKCWPFQEYANNCVSQSNSKRAREERLLFFEKLLLNRVSGLSLEAQLETIIDIVQYFKLENQPLLNIGEYYLPNVHELNKLKVKITF